jgi:hypothetical protein
MAALSTSRSTSGLETSKTSYRDSSGSLRNWPLTLFTQSLTSNSDVILTPPLIRQACIWPPFPPFISIQSCTQMQACILLQEWKNKPKRLLGRFSNLSWVLDTYFEHKKSLRCKKFSSRYEYRTAWLSNLWVGRFSSHSPKTTTLWPYFSRQNDFAICPQGRLILGSYNPLYSDGQLLTNTRKKPKISLKTV